MAKNYFNPQIEVVVENGSNVKIGECTNCSKVTRDSLDVEFIEIMGLCSACASRAEGFNFAF